MKSNNRPQVCPICGQTFTDRPAISRLDNQTEICLLCGSRQALEALGVSEDEQNEILGVIKDATEKMRRA